MTEDSGFTFNLEGSIDFLVQLESGGGSASMAKPVAGSQLQCKFGANQCFGTTEPPLGLIRHRRGALYAAVKIALFSSFMTESHSVRASRRRPIMSNVGARQKF
jgi:hypothetical protein